MLAFEFRIYDSVRNVQLLLLKPRKLGGTINKKEGSHTNQIVSDGELSAC